MIIASRTSNDKWFQNANMPVVSIDRYIDESVPMVASDSMQGGALATEHLIQRGCRKIAHISGDPNLKVVANERTVAFEKICKERGIEFVNKRITEQQMFKEETYRDIIEMILDEHPNIDGFFASNAIMSLEAVHVFRERGLSVPRDIRLVGYDDTVLTRLTYPAITTIAQPTYEIGRYAIELLIREIKGETVPNRTILPVKLIMRQTT